MDRRRSRPLVSAWTMGVLLALGACGTAEQGGPGTGETSVTQPAPGTAVPTTGEETGQTAPPSPTGGTPTPTGATGGTTTPEPSQAAPTGEPGSTPTGATTTPVAEPTLAAGSQQVLDLVLGRLDTATLDGRSQCLLDFDDVAGQEGLRLGNRSHMLADGGDVWVVCLTTAAAPEGSTLSLTDPGGLVWGQGALSLLGAAGLSRPIGFGHTGTSVRGVAVVQGAQLLPVGFSYERLALDGSTRAVTTLNLVVPTTRPGGPWTVTVTSTDGSSSEVTLQTPACVPAAVAAQRPWPVDPARRVVTFADLQELENLMFEGALPADLSPVDHCLAMPVLVGRQWEDAVRAVDEARLGAGLGAGATNVGVTCVDGSSGVVRSQTPAPGGTLTGTVGLDVDYPCPPMPDVVGQTVADVEALMTRSSQPPYSFVVRPSPQCADGGTSVVQRSFPAAGETSYLVETPATLQVELFC